MPTDQSTNIGIRAA